MTTEQKTFTKEEYEHHGEWMFDHGKCVAYQDILKTEVKWCVSMVDRKISKPILAILQILSRICSFR